jgi:DNA mismatch repair protein MutS2
VRGPRRRSAYHAPVQFDVSDALELGLVLERLAELTTFDGGRQLAIDLRPSGDPAEVGARRARTEEALLLLERGVHGPAGAHDVRDLLGRVAVGGVLDEAELDRVRATVEGALAVRESALEHQQDAPGLCGLLAALDAGALAAIGSRLAGALEDHGGLADRASPELGRLRRALVMARQDAQDKVRALSGSLSAHLQEGFVTERSGRPVLAVRASSRSEVPGVVHDSSSSGQTLFIEPFALVEATNRVRALEGAEREERERILDELSREVAVYGDEIGEAVSVLAVVDLSLACAALSRAWGGCPVEDSAEVELLEARHPLLSRETAVPIDLPFGDLRAVVVSGPNAGGKTVALKTLGLLAVLGQCGLRPPAKQARLPTFAQVLTDIGDGQSIAENLSTFSAHVSTLAAIVNESGPHTLVLLDEVAGGTDPREGAALARSVIAELVRRGSLVIVSTHHWELKEWAADTEQVANAAVAVDPATLEPRYELEVGQPGASHAFAIARSHGLPEGVVEAAEAALAQGRASAEGLLAEASEARAMAARVLAEAQEERTAAERERESVEKQRAELDSRLSGINAEARREREKARAEMSARLAGAEGELESLRREIAAARRAEASSEGGATAGRDRRLGAASAAARRARAEVAGAAEPVRTREARLGDRVKDASLGFRGRIVAIEGGVALVDGGGARVRVPVERLEVLASESDDATPVPSTPPIAPPPPGGGDEIDVRGQRAEEARAAVRGFVDGAGQRALERVTIVHGRGTGALRAAVRDELRVHPMVAGFESAGPAEGGDGATVVELR